MFDTNHRHGEDDVEYGVNFASANGIVPLQNIPQPSTETMLTGLGLSLLIALAWYGFGKEMCKLNPLLAPFVR